MRSKDITELLIKSEVISYKCIEPEEVKNHPPESVIEINEYAYTFEDRTDNEINMLLNAKQTLHLKTIKNIVIFFLVMWLIGVTIGLVYIVMLAT